VVEDRKMLGIVSKFDFLSAFALTSSQIVPHYNELMGRPVADVMTLPSSTSRGATQQWRKFAILNFKIVGKEWEFPGLDGSNRRGPNMALAAGAVAQAGPPLVRGMLYYAVAPTQLGTTSLRPPTLKTKVNIGT
jgi:hypothetical protein